MTSLIIRTKDQFGYLYDEFGYLISTHCFTEYRITGNAENIVKFYLGDKYSGRVSADSVRVV